MRALTSCRRAVAFDPNRGGDKALHQIALRRADIGFVNGDAVFTQLFPAHQLAMGAAVEAKTGWR
jgi:hypothetical protein